MVSVLWVLVGVAVSLVALSGWAGVLIVEYGFNE
jgi:hypothetical protein